MAQTNPLELLRALVAAGFDFVVIGGVAANLHGSAYSTLDTDVVAPFTPDNLGRLLNALRPLSARFAPPANRTLPESAAELSSYRNLYLSTDLGRLDVLSEAAGVGDYEAVARGASRFSLGGFELRAMGLDDLIASKQAMRREKDRPVELELRAIRDRLKPR